MPHDRHAHTVWQAARAPANEDRRVLLQGASARAVRRDRSGPDEMEGPDGLRLDPHIRSTGRVADPPYARLGFEYRDRRQAENRLLRKDDTASRSAGVVALAAGGTKEHFGRRHAAANRDEQQALSAWHVHATDVACRCHPRHRDQLLGIAADDRRKVEVTDLCPGTGHRHCLASEMAERAQRRARTETLVGGDHLALAAEAVDLELAALCRGEVLGREARATVSVE